MTILCGYCDAPALTLSTMGERTSRIFCCADHIELCRNRAPSNLKRDCLISQDICEVEATLLHQRRSWRSKQAWARRRAAEMEKRT